MSSLIFCTEESQALVATDTLGTTPDGQPFKFTTKAFALPHLRTVMAGVGVGGFLGRWFVSANEFVVRGIEHLDYHAPATLADMWTALGRDTSTAGMTTTVYHFGLSEVSGSIKSFAYRSTNNFKSESIGYGVGVKPECKVPQNYQFPADIKAMMDEQRAIQLSRPKAERIYIGGEIQIHHLTRDGFNIYTLDRFDDFDQDEAAMYKNFRQRAAGNP